MVSDETVKSGVDEERGLSAAFGHKITELKDLAIDHKLNKISLVLFHIFSLSRFVLSCSVLTYHL